ncbi:LysR family transcriptional regulator [Erwinia rhapontici]|uniref:LysR family transcriptional regulator n=1 Tax=Erwinia rhapontici TaxID=55212 RepID=A0ABN6DNL2_ERWRD|nr:LysR family transcriptional regulator [Erwinia rhapontici]BCQ35150.1 LysR family transcriptional regulator [Erwinia rhapontici]BCQ40053.1 LysR family transcriptional regulator [Erwinia rhapontici]
MHLNLRSLDLNLLLVFDAVYRHQSVTRAASELALSNSAISHALGRLRRYCDDELFYRVGHQMQPTLFASDLAVTVHDSLHLLNQGVQKRPRFDPASSQHSFTFAVTDFTAFSLFPRLIGHLQHVAPGLRFQLVHSQQKVALHELMSGRVDFALGFSENHDRKWPEIDELDWLEDEYVTIANPAFFPADPPLTQQQYIAARHLVITPWNEESGYIDSELAAIGLKREVALRMPSMLGAPFIIAQSPLLLTLPRHAAQTLNASADYVIHPLPFRIPPFRVKVYSWQKNSQREACHWLLARLRELKMA